MACPWRTTTRGLRASLSSNVTKVHSVSALVGKDVRAYEGLSGKMQHMLSDLIAIHHTTRTFSRADHKIEHIGGKAAPKVLSTEHPVVRTHPKTGAKGFYQSIFPASIKGMTPAESGALVNFLYRHIEIPDFQFRFRWQPNSIAMWDNRCTQHRVCGDNKTASRRLERITIDGDRPL
jgi:taurine dioxygenase